MVKKYIVPNLSDTFMALVAGSQPSTTPAHLLKPEGRARVTEPEKIKSCSVRCTLFPARWLLLKV